MGWLAGYEKRFVLTFQSGSLGSCGFSIALPAYNDDFWNTIDTDGYGLRVTEADGLTQTSVVYDVTSFNKTNRAGDLEVEGLVVDSTAVRKTAFVYYGPTSTATDGTGSPSVSPATAEPFIASGLPSGQVLVPTRQIAGQTVPDIVVGKDSAESIWVWFDVTGALDRPITGTTFGQPRYEEVQSFSWIVEDGGTPQGSMTSVNEIAHVETLDGRTLLGGVVKAGSSGTNYTGVLTMNTCLPGSPSTTARVVQFRITIQVQDLTEPT